MKNGTGVQGLWKSITCAELSLVTTASGALVGVYRVPEPSGSKEYPLSGYAIGDSVAFCVPFPEHGSIVCWCGALAEDVDGPRLDFIRRLVGDSVVQNEVEDTFRPVRQAGIGESVMPVLPLPRAAGGADAPA